MPAHYIHSHPASGAVNPAIVQHVERHGKASDSAVVVQFGSIDGDPHTVVTERAAMRLFRRGVRPVVNGVVMSPADLQG